MEKSIYYLLVMTMQPVIVTLKSAMYLGIDVGGTKTLLGVLDDHGTIVQKAKFPTPQDYDAFLGELETTLRSFDIQDFRAVGAGIPGIIDRKNGIGLTFGNLAWKKVSVQADIEKITHAPAKIENDAKLAGLSEAMLHQNVHRVLYITISTGIGYAFINDGHIDTNIGDTGGSSLSFAHQGKFVPWESFASGKAIVQTFGQQAKDIQDPVIWQKIAHNLGQGFAELIAVTEPEIIIIGGSVGNYLEQYIEPLMQELKQFESPLLKIPPIEAAKRPDEAVLYGCYDLLKQYYGQ